VRPEKAIVSLEQARSKILRAYQIIGQDHPVSKHLRDAVDAIDREIARRTY
jgi:hypothetical protein